MNFLFQIFLQMDGSIDSLYGLLECTDAYSLHSVDRSSRGSWFCRTTLGSGAAEAVLLRAWTYPLAQTDQ